MVTLPMTFKDAIAEIDAFSNHPKSDVLYKSYASAIEQQWSGPLVLGQLLDQYHGSSINLAQKEALTEIIKMLTCGELVAWTVSSQLAAEINELEGKLAATAQASDEARHLNTFRLYANCKNLNTADYNTLPDATYNGFSQVLAAPTLAHRLVGMQLMVEPVAIVLFEELRQVNICPVLTDLLAYYKRDEARHIQFGTNFLPYVLKKLSTAQLMHLFAWQITILMKEIDGLKAHEPHLKALGIDPLKLFALAQAKQAAALDEILDELNLPAAISMAVQGLFRLKMDHTFNDVSYLQAFQYFKG